LSERTPARKVKLVFQILLKWSVNIHSAFCRGRDFATFSLKNSKWCLINPWNTAYNRKRKQEHFWIILWRALGRGIWVRKLFQ